MTTARRTAVWFVVLLGLVSLFADVTYEAARGINGPYLAILGASATAVGLVSGLGELLGYGLRIVSGIWSDKTRRYWTFTIVGYAVNLLAVPLMALAGRWEWAIGLILMERIGKSIRTPARDAMLSHATSVVGRGWGFALHEAMDQIGGMTGPIVVSVILAWKQNYALAFGVLAIPAVLALATLVTARAIYPRPQEMESKWAHQGRGRFSPLFWLYTGAIGLAAMAYADFPLMAYHIKSNHLVSDAWIPLLYAGAMGIDGVAALIFGRLYDRFGTPVLMGAFAISCGFAPLAFSENIIWVIAGLALWGIGLGAIESVVRAAVAGLVPQDRRATGYGLFNTGFGVAWFIGSAAMGAMYDHWRTGLVWFSVIGQLGCIAVLAVFHRKEKAGREAAV